MQNGQGYNYNLMNLGVATYAQVLSRGGMYQGQGGQQQHQVPPGYGQQQQQPMYHVPQQRIASAPTNPIVKLPFFDVQAELLKPSTLAPQNLNNRFQEAQFQFSLSPKQATDIASHRDIQQGPLCDYLYQIQLRFCPLPLSDPSKEVSDEFPPNVSVHVNGKMVPLPNPIPSNKPGVEPKRPPRPVNITSHCKLSPILHNNIQIRWGTELNKGWICGVWLVMRCTSTDLLERLKKRGARDPEQTRKLIVDKLNDNDMEVATTSLKVSVLCPLGKMRMRLPCRPITCDHLQCFDAATFLQMNEKKPTWNCPVCDSKAIYDSLRIDGYFQQIIQSEKLPNDENEIILERDGSWKPAPKDEPAASSSSASAAAALAASKNGNSADEDVCIDLSDDDDDIPLAAPPLPPLPSAGAAPPPPPPPPPLPAEIECIDLD